MGALKEMIARVGMDASGFAIGAKKVESAAGRMGRNVSRSIAGFTAGLIGAAALESLARKTIDYGSKINDLATRLGVGTEALQEFGYAAAQNGSSLESMVSFIEKVGVARDKALGGDAGALASFGELGVSQADLQTARSEDLVKIIGENVKNGDIQQIIKPLREVGGRAAGDLVAAFKAGLAEMAGEARQLGIIIDEANIKALDDVGDSISALGSALVAHMAPAIIFVVDRIYDLIAGFNIVGAALVGFFGNLKYGQAILGAGMLAVPGMQRAGVQMMKGSLSKVDSEGKALFDATVKEEADKEAARKAARNAPAAAPPAGNFQGAGSDTNQAPGFTTEKLTTDSLAKMGGFVGGAETAMVTIAKESKTLLQQIARNTTPRPDADTPDVVDG